jgi:hypothetical protein
MDEESREGFVKHIQTHKRGSLIYADPAPVKPSLVSRFLAKVGLEVMAHKVRHVPGWEMELTFKQELDEIRQFARYGGRNKSWPYYERRLYDEHKMFTGEDGEPFEILHEFDTLYTEQQELYAIVIILGIEYAINMGGPEIDEYEKWLAENNFLSPLYPEGQI